MANRLYEIAFRIGGKIAASFPQSLSSAAGKLDQVGKKISQLESAQGQVTRFRALHNQIDATKLKLRQAEAEVKHLGSAMGPMTAAMAKQFEAAKGKAEKLRLEYRGQAAELRNVKSAMEAAGVAQRSLTADSAKMAANLAKAQTQQKRMQAHAGAVLANTKAKEAARSKFDRSKGRVVGAAAGIAAVALPAVVAAKFEDSMVRAGALAHATDGELAKLTATARQLGRDTRFSASSAAEGMGFLAMSGFNAGEILGAMPGMLNIAAAGMVDVGTASDITSNILRGFGMEAGQAGRLGDVLTNTFTNSNTTLAALGDTMKYVAPIAKATGLSLEKTAASAGILANAGIKGEQAGTAMRAMLSRLAAPPKKARDALASLGIKASELKDAAGNMVPLDEILAKLNAKMAKLGTGTRQAKVTDLFGMEAATAATVLLSGQASGALAQMTTTVAKSGTAAEVAAKQNATMAGQWDNFKGSAEDVGIALGYQLIPTLKRLIDTVVPIINRITQWADQHPKLTQALILGAAAMAVLNVAMVSGGLALNGIRLGLLSAQGAFLAFKGATLASVLATAASAASIALVVGGLVGLASIAYQLQSNWNPISQWWGEMWDRMADKVRLVSKAALWPVWAVAKLTGKVDDVFGKDKGSNIPMTPGEYAAQAAQQEAEAYRKVQAKRGVLDYSRGNMLTWGRGAEGQMAVAQKLASVPAGGRLESAGRLSAAEKLSKESAGKGDTINFSPQYSPQINLPPGSPRETQDAAQRGLATSQREFDAMMKKYMAGQGRLAFGQ